MTEELTLKVSNDEQGYETLFQVMVQEAQMYENLVEKMQKKQQAIIEGNIPVMNELTASEQNIIHKAEGLGALRLSLMQQIFRAWGVSSGKVCLKEMMRYSGKSSNASWVKLAQKLRIGARQISLLNRENQNLLNSSLQFIRDLVKLIVPSEDTRHETYGESGKVESNAKSNKMLDCQI